jgi:hypothetical protein
MFLMACEWYAFALTSADEVSDRTRRFAKMFLIYIGDLCNRDACFTEVSSLGFALICCALLLYVCPELPRVGSDDAAEFLSSSASPLQFKRESMGR